MMPPSYLDPFADFTPEDATAYADRILGAYGMSECGDWIQAEVGARAVLDYGCGPGTDAGRYLPDRYVGYDVCEPLLDEARRRHPDYVFTSRHEGLAPMPVVIVKSVLEHQQFHQDATRIIEDAMRLATEVVYLAWHTPPGAREEVRLVTGASGRTIYQSTFDRGRFAAYDHDRIAILTPRGVHEIWRIAK